MFHQAGLIEGLLQALVSTELVQVMIRWADFIPNAAHIVQ